MSLCEIHEPDAGDLAKASSSRSCPCRILKDEIQNSSQHIMDPNLAEILLYFFPLVFKVFFIQLIFEEDGLKCMGPLIYRFFFQ